MFPRLPLVRLATHPPRLHSPVSRLSVMGSNTTEAPNASGLTPNDSKSLNERSAEPHEEKLLQGIKEVRRIVNTCTRHTETETKQLYSCKPSEVVKFDIVYMRPSETSTHILGDLQNLHRGRRLPRPDRSR